VNLWYRAKDPLGPWTDISSPPAPVRAAVPPDTSSSDVVEGPPPDVLTATEPTELIATDGPPEYASLVQDELLYVTNTESDVVLEVETQDLYVLISGRWFRAPSTDGPWTFVRGDELPASFKRVPPDSPKGNILASVAGTDLAEDAVADAEIPQTSAIRRDDQSLQVTYDGDPDFEPIEGTNLEYAVNTDAEVILADGRYYACDQGVWYIADDPDGPWSVSDTRPLGLEEIPPSCPVYDVRYVYVYEATPEVVYVGYLPGYLGWYPYYGTVVYGTGHRYHGWRGRHHYYPRHATWGFHARYNPWLSRWSFGFSYSTGFLRVGSRWRSDATVARTRTRSTWFGPGGFRRPLVAQDMALLRTRPQRRVRATAAEGLPSNLYNRTENITRVDRVRNRSIARPIPRPSPVPNDVFGGKDGRVYRREGDGTWQVRTGSEWKPTNVPVLPPATTTQRDREETPLPPAKPMPPRESRRRGEPAVERPAPPRNIPTEQPVPSRDRPTPPRERPTPPRERPMPPRERPMPPRERPEPPRERTTPPQEPSRERPAPGNLEREYRARERSNREDKPAPPPAVRPTPPPEEPKDKKSEEPRKERPTQRSREDVKRERGR
jgi:hypothetical protein